MRNSVNVECGYGFCDNTTHRKQTRATTVVVAHELKKLRERAGLSQARMAREMGLRGASSVQRYEDPAYLGENGRLSLDHLSRTIKVLEGRGEPPITAAEIYPLFGINPDGIYFLEGKPLLTVRVGTQDVVPKRNIPFVSLSDLATLGVPMPHKARPDAPRFPVPEGVSDGAVATEVADRSGEPEFPQGTILYIDPDATLEPGCFVVAQVEGESEAKIGRYALRVADDGTRIVEVTAINPHYPSFILSHTRPGRVLGRIVRATRTY